MNKVRYEFLIPTVLLFLCFLSGCTDLNDSGQAIDKDEAYKIASGDLSLSQVSSGNFSEHYTVDEIASEEGSVNYLFRFQTQDYMITEILVSGINGSILSRKNGINEPLHKIPPDYFENKKSIPESVKEKGALIFSANPGISVMENGINLTLLSVECQEDYSLFCFSADSDMIQNYTHMAEDLTKINTLNPEPKGKIIVNSQIIEEFDGYYTTGWASFAYPEKGIKGSAFSVKANPLPSDTTVLMIKIDSLFETSGKWEFDVM